MIMVDLALKFMLMKAWSAVVLIIPLMETVSSVVSFKLTFWFGHSSDADLHSPPNGLDILPV